MYAWLLLLTGDIYVHQVHDSEHDSHYSFVYCSSNYVADHAVHKSTWTHQQDVCVCGVAYTLHAMAVPHCTGWSCTLCIQLCRITTSLIHLLGKPHLGMHLLQQTLRPQAASLLLSQQQCPCSALIPAWVGAPASSNTWWFTVHATSLWCVV